MKAHSEFVPITRHNGVAVSVDTATGQFHAGVGSRDISRSDLRALYKEIDRASTSVEVIILSPPRGSFYKREERPDAVQTASVVEAKSGKSNRYDYEPPAIGRIDRFRDQSGDWRELGPEDEIVPYDEALREQLTALNATYVAEVNAISNDAHRRLTESLGRYREAWMRLADTAPRLSARDITRLQRAARSEPADA